MVWRGWFLPLSCALLSALAAATAGCGKCPSGAVLAGEVGIRQWCEIPGAEGAAVKHGPEWIYADDGHLLTTRHYVDGEFNGKWTTWHDNGKKHSGVEYVDGKEEGTQTIWYESGKVWVKRDFHRGRWDGPKTEWHENGNKAVSGHYHANTPCGEWTSWDESGEEIRTSDHGPCG